MVELVQTLREERLLPIVLQEGVPRPQLLVLLHAAVEELTNRRVVRQHQAIHLLNGPKKLLKAIEKKRKETIEHFIKEYQEI